MRIPLRRPNVIAIGVMCFMAAFIAFIWNGDPRGPVVYQVGEFLQPVFYLLLVPLPLAWMLFSFKSQLLTEELEIAVLAMLIPPNSYLWGYALDRVIRRFVRLRSMSH